MPYTLFSRRNAQTIMQKISAFLVAVSLVFNLGFGSITGPAVAYADENPGGGSGAQDGGSQLPETGSASSTQNGNGGQSDDHSGTGENCGSTGQGEDECEDEGGENGECEESGAGQSDCAGVPEEKVTICHLPPGNPENAQSITISVNAAQLPGHLQHGDSVGSCEVPPPTTETGTIRVCKIIASEDGAIATSSDGLPAGAFSVELKYGFTPATATSYATTSWSAATFAPDADLLGNDGVNDAVCVSYRDLPVGSYYYGEEAVSGSEWAAPKYNDQYSLAVSSLADLFVYSPELFTPSASDDNDRNQNADGHIVLSSNAVRTLVVLNTHTIDDVPPPPPGSSCGNEVVEVSLGEQCDDGNTISGDGCSNQCRVEQVNSCTLTLVSDMSDMIVGGGNAVATYSANPSWTALIPGATWIWKTFFVAAPTLDDTTVFEKTFVIEKPIAGASLVVAADNSYELSINGTPFASDLGEFNYRESGKDTYAVSAQLVSGTNTLRFSVKNWGTSGASAQSNPAGLLYRLEVSYGGEGCIDLPPPPPPVCSDSLDNDTDGLIDFPLDLGCDTPTDTDENNKPVITIVGANPMEITLGTLFTDPGATAFDLEDGTITPNIIATGTVNTALLGSYTIFYDVSDSDGLAADQKSRIVRVVPPQVCTTAVDVVLVIDRSGSMKSEGESPEQPLADAKAAAGAFIDTLSSTTDKVSIVSYNDTATLHQQLTSNFTSAKASYASISASGNTNIGAAIDKADQELTVRGRTGAKRVIIVLTDGNPTRPTSPSPTAYAVTQALEAKEKGYVIYTIGLGSAVNTSLLAQIATSPAHSYLAPTSGELTAIYQAISEVECDRDPARVTGKKWNDKNGNGVVDPEDVGLANWKIKLTPLADATERLTTTNASGSYTFMDVQPGNYMLCEVAQSGWRQTAPATTTNAGCYTVNVAEGATIDGKDFLNTQLPKPVCSDGIDNDGDGGKDFGQDPGCTGPNDPDENEKPVITVLPPNPMTITLGSVFTDPGATAADPEDGNITHKIVRTGSVNTLVLGSYTLAYNATDTKNLAADQKTRTVIVATVCSDGIDNDGDGTIDFGQDAGCGNPNDPDENTPPVVTLLGVTPMNVIMGTLFTDPGATAFDLEDGTITPSVSGTVNTAVLGAYLLTYTATDSDGATATPKIRTVNVVPVPEVPPVCSDSLDNDTDGLTDFPLDLGCDTPTDTDENNKPVITVVGANPMEITLGTLFTDPGATAFDLEDGTITPNIIATGTVNTALLGSYTIFYDVSDSDGLAADQKSRIVRVVSACSDGRDNDADGKIDFPEDVGCDTPTDDSENEKPVITLLGDVVMTIFAGSVFTDPGATASDTEDGNITDDIVSGGSVNTNTLGSYTLTFDVSDSQGLAADQKSRTVSVVSAPCTVNCGGGGTPPVCSDGGDNDGDGLADFPRDPGCSSSDDPDERDTGPELTLLGANPMTITLGSAFTDPGATASDPEEGDITSRIVATGTVTTTQVGTYSILYTVSDSQGHAATPKTRSVIVIQPSNPGCTVNCGGGGGPITLAIFNERLSVTSTTTAIVTWNTNLPATSRVVYGSISVPVLDAAPMYGYPITTATSTTLTTSHSAAIDIVAGLTYHFRPVSSDHRGEVRGIELHHEPSAPLPEACFYLREYLRLGANNNPSEVIKLQAFLHDIEGHGNIEVTGFFDLATDAAVRSFQEKYRADVLDPWALPSTTGFVYYTTQKKVNEIYCNRAFPLNPLQESEILAFSALMRSILSQPGGTTITVPLVGTNVSGPARSGETSAFGEEVAARIAAGIPAIGEEGSVAGTSSIAEEGREGASGRRISIDSLLAVTPSATTALRNAGDDAEHATTTAKASALAAVAGSFAEKMNVPVWSLYLSTLILLIAAIIAVWILLRKRDTEDAQVVSAEVVKK